MREARRRAKTELVKGVSAIMATKTVARWLPMSIHYGIKLTKIQPHCFLMYVISFSIELNSPLRFEFFAICCPFEYGCIHMSFIYNPCDERAIYKDRQLVLRKSYSAWHPRHSYAHGLQASTEEGTRRVELARICAFQSSFVMCNI